ncbi:MAG: hypothetical protein ACT4QE_17765 [Anaerolineales bacterium]
MIKRLLMMVLVCMGVLFTFAPGGARAQDEGGDDDEWMRLCRRILASGHLPARCREKLADESWEHYCRRVYGTDAWTRRCAPQRPDEDLAHYCRRVYGTDEWTRRCAQPTPTFDPIEYCRRIYGTDEWTRRCLNLVPTRTPSVAPPTREPHREATAVPVTEVAPQPTHRPAEPISEATATPGRGRP